MRDESNEHGNVHDGLVVVDNLHAAVLDKVHGRRRLVRCEGAVAAQQHLRGMAQQLTVLMVAENP